MNLDKSFRTMRSGIRLLVFSLIAVVLSSAYASTFNVPSGTTSTQTGLTETERTVKQGDGTLVVNGSSSLKRVTVSAGTLNFNGGTATIADTTATSAYGEAMFNQTGGRTVIDGGATVVAKDGTYFNVNNGILLITNATLDASGITGHMMNAFNGNNSECRIIIDDGGVLKASVLRASGTETAGQKENVSVDLNRGGKLYLKRFWTGWDMHHYGRINFNGGQLYATETATSAASTWLFQEDTQRVPWVNGDTAPTVLDGGFYLNTVGDNYVHLPFVSGAVHDGGVHFSGDGVLFWYANNSTYNGGTWLESNSGARLALSANYGGDSALGAVPAAPTTNIWSKGADHTLLALEGEVAIHPNRTVYIPNGGRLRLASAGRLIVGGEIKGEAVGGLDYPTNTWIDARTTTSWTGPMVIGPGEGRTNDVGRLYVSGHLEVTSGVTRVASSTAWGTGDGDAMVVVSGNESAYNAAKGHLVVNGGTLTSPHAKERYLIVRKYGQFEVTNGGKIDMPGITYLNGLSSPAATTVSNCGEINVVNFQVGNSTTSILNLNSGGMVVSPKFWCHSGATVTINFDGGGIRYTGLKHIFHEGSAGTLADWANVSLRVKEGGAVFDTASNIWLDLPLQSDAAQDGGLIKRGANVLILEVATSLNGPTRVEGGTIQCRVDNALPPTTLTLTNSAHVAFSKYDTGDYTTYTHTAQTLRRIEGSGTLEYCRNLHVTNSIAPSVNGTLTFDWGCDLAGDLVIAGDANGCGKMSLIRDTTDLSKLTLKIADFSTFDKAKAALENGMTGYQILQVSSADRYANKFTLPADWPSNWGVKYTQNGAYLRYKSGTILVIQ